MQPEEQPQEVQIVQHLDTSPLAALEYTYNWDPERFIFDFKSLTPQFGPGGQPTTVVVTHKAVTLTPWLAKTLVAQLGKAVKEYEKKFGTITQSEAQLKAMRDMKAAQTSTPRQADWKPSYMG